ncbi:hypothetical protein Pan97_07890 [Bremerella volcania]|uniref:Uncharacterized protein n=1 Tax=Bremerella volcania TaxID=2527984 RepID=A0A518C3I9_9BACT|nr:hypothetical protein [Bremerella volcania]QDU73789.1 hypothetical protein Pan97_07890 [Bremerella volcania]
MNQELMKTVERVVRPLPCDKTHKNRMRADLYSQLERIFEEELAKEPNESLALSRAQDRFGETAQLKKELLATIPRIHQWQTALDHFITGHREGRSTLRFAVGFGSRASVVLTLFFAVMIGWGTFYWQDPIIFGMWPAFLAIALLFGGNCFTNVILGDLALQAFQGDSFSARLKKPYLLVLAAVGAGLSVAVSLLTLIEVASPGAYWSGLPGVFLWPMGMTIALFLVVVTLMAKVELVDRRWSQLSLD